MDEQPTGDPGTEALRLVDRLGAEAPRHARRLAVQHGTAGERQSASYWIETARLCESLLADDERVAKRPKSGEIGQ